MQKNMRSWQEWLFLILVITAVQFIVLTLIAMLFYSGGTAVDPHTIGYSFTKNFFSDLGTITTYDGDSNIIPRSLFTIALTLVGLGLVGFSFATLSLFTGRPASKLLSLFGSVSGIVTGLAYVGVAITPADRYLGWHILSVQVAFTAFLGTAVAYLLAILLTRNYPNKYAAVYLGFAILLGFYIWLLFGGPDIDNPQGLLIQVVGQKIIVYAAIVCMLIQGYGAWRLELRHK